MSEEEERTTSRDWILNLWFSLSRFSVNTPNELRKSKMDNSPMLEEVMKYSSKESYKSPSGAKLALDKVLNSGFGDDSPSSTGDPSTSFVAIDNGGEVV